MTRDDIDRIQSSFRRLETDKGAAGAELYDKLFQLDPSLKPLFKGNMGRQGEKLVESLGLAVRNLNNPYALEEGFRRMGERHRLYGVREQDYETMRQAMVWMLEQKLGTDFTNEIRTSWNTMFDLVATMMRKDTLNAVTL